MSAYSQKVPSKPSVSVEDADVGMTNAALAKMPEIGDARYLGVVRGNQFTTPQYTEHYKNFYITERHFSETNFVIAPDYWAGEYIKKYGISPYIDFEGDFEEPFKKYIKEYISSQGKTDVTDENYLEKLNELLSITTTLLDKLYYLRGEYLATNDKQVVPQDPSKPARAQAQANARAQANPGRAAANDIPLDPIPYIDVSGEKKELTYDQTQDIMTKLKQEVTEIYDKFDDLFIKFSLDNKGEATQKVFDDVIKKMNRLAHPLTGTEAEKELKFGNYLSIMRQVKSFYPELYDKVETAMKPTLPRLSVAIPNKNNVGNPNAEPNSPWSPGSATLETGRSISYLPPGSALPSPGSPLQPPYTPQKPLPTNGGKGSKKISSRFKPQIV